MKKLLSLLFAVTLFVAPLSTNATPATDLLPMIDGYVLVTHWVATTTSDPMEAAYFNGTSTALALASSLISNGTEDWNTLITLASGAYGQMLVWQGYPLVAEAFRGEYDAYFSAALWLYYAYNP